MPFRLAGTCDVAAVGSEAGDRCSGAQLLFSAVAQVSISRSCLMNDEAIDGLDPWVDEVVGTMTATGACKACCCGGPSGSKRGLGSRDVDTRGVWASRLAIWCFSLTTA